MGLNTHPAQLNGKGFTANKSINDDLLTCNWVGLGLSHCCIETFDSMLLAAPTFVLVFICVGSLVFVTLVLGYTGFILVLGYTEQ